MSFGGMVMMSLLDDKLCVTIIATGFNTLPHTGLSIKAPKKNKII